MNLSVSSFLFTPSGKPARQQEVHAATLHFITQDDDALRARFYIETTRPGEARDDRGLPDWDAPVNIDVTTLAFAPQISAHSSVTTAHDPSTLYDRFLYYWDHNSFSSSRVILRTMNNLLHVDFTGRCEAGNSVSFQATGTSPPAAQ